MFEHYLYQPFFNLLVGLYWGLERFSPSLGDMGIAVIVFSLVIRVFLLPLTLASERSEKEKRLISEKVNALKKTYSHDPITLKVEIRRIMRANSRIVLATTFNLIIQLIIILMLYRIFTTGLEGRDYHLLYNFMPQVSHVNLLFLGKYDLSHTNSTLNLIQSFMIFVVELLIALRSVLPVSRRDIFMMQFILPIGSYLIFMLMPAGKKVFIITSLAFSAVYNSARLLQTLIRRFIARFQPPFPPQTTPNSDASDIVSPPAP